MNQKKQSELQLSKVVTLFPTRKPRAISFKHVTKKTVPNQSMTLKTILKKYTRGEPVSQVAASFFETRFGDLSKFYNMDHLDRQIFNENFKEKVTHWGETLKQKEEAAKAEAEARASAPPPANNA